MRSIRSLVRPSVARALDAGGALFAAVVAGCVTLSVNTTDASAVVATEAQEQGLGFDPDGSDAVEAVDAPSITDWPITYDEERARLTGAFLDYRRGDDFERSGDVWADATIVPRVIVLHHTAGSNAKSAWNTFESPADRRAGLKEHQKLNTSTHFIIDREGHIFRLYHETLAGRHAIGLNHLSIGVENVGGIEGYPLTDAQVEANVALIRYLEGKYTTITHVIGHHEYREMEGHPYFEEVDSKFRTVKSDPGDAFMSKVRAEISDLALSGPPGASDVIAEAD